VRAVDYAAARPFWLTDIVVFSTYQELVRGLTAWTETQWDNVWPRTEGFAFDLENTAVLASADGRMATAIAPWTNTGFHPDGTRFERPVEPPSCSCANPMDAGLACIRTCRCKEVCRRTAMAIGKSRRGRWPKPDQALSGLYGSGARRNEREVSDQQHAARNLVHWITLHGTTRKNSP